MTAADPLVRAVDVTKVFPGVTALHGVSLDVVPGQVHCLVGENGAGKSTLIKCLTGIYTPEQGNVEVAGTFRDVAHVPQEIDLFEEMSAAENLFMPFERTRMGRLSQRRQLDREAARIMAEFGIHGSPRQPVRELSVADQQLLQIARATLFDAKVLILDEPTASLTENDAERVFAVVRRARERGMGVVYISHKLDEVLSIGDYVTVLRNGWKVAESPMADVDERWLIREMTGRSFAKERSFVPERVSDDVILSVRDASGPGFRDVSFDLHAGEVLGFSGLVGAGRTELMLALYGYGPLYAGTVEIGGQRIKRPTPDLMLKRGMVYLSEDRKRMGILGRMPVAFNVSILGVRNHLSQGGFVRRRRERSEVAQLVRDYDVRTPTLQTDMRLLSGGNQQKAIIARTMAVGPKIVILDEPTKGIDVAAKYEIYTLIKRLAEEQGLGIILVSSEMDEIIHCSNRVVVMHDGVVESTFERPLEREQLVAAMFGKHHQEVVAP